MPEYIEIDGSKIGLGEQRVINLNIARLPTYTSIDLSVHVFRGQQDGPVLLLTGGLHGDEINGVEIIRRMISEELVRPCSGTVIAIPLVNIYGFIQNVRGVPDGKDINRSFPGVKGGSLAKLLAYTLMREIIPQVDCGIDFHTGGASRSNYPQIRAVLNLPGNRELAEAFAPPMIIHSGLIDKSFRKAAHRMGKHILVYESGEAMRFDELGIQEGINGTLRLMRHLQMRDEAPAGLQPDIFRKTSWVRARMAGLFHPAVPLGEEVRKRRVIGRITDPFGSESRPVKATYSGRLIGINYSPVVHKGDALAHIAYNG